MDGTFAQKKQHSCPCPPLSPSPLPLQPSLPAQSNTSPVLITSVFMPVSTPPFCHPSEPSGCSKRGRNGPFINISHLM